VITPLSKLVDSNHAKIIPMDKTFLDSYTNETAYFLEILPSGLGQYAYSTIRIVDLAACVPLAPFPAVCVLPQQP
jgi:hypothetical protein